MFFPLPLRTEVREADETKLVRLELELVREAISPGSLCSAVDGIDGRRGMAEEFCLFLLLGKSSFSDGNSSLSLLSNSLISSRADFVLRWKPWLCGNEGGSTRREESRYGTGSTDANAAEKTSSSFVGGGGG